VARLPHSGLSGPHSGMESIIGVVGPLATNLADLELFCKVLLDSEPWRFEPSLIPLPWKPSQAKKLERKLKIGIIHNDGIHAPHPPIKRVLSEAEKKLIAAGHEIIPFPVHLHESIVTCIDKLYFLDSGAEYYDILNSANEPPTPLLSWLLTKPTTQSRTISEQWVLHRERSRLQEEYQKLWRETGIDCLLCPGNVAVANALGESKYWGYTTVWNALDRAVITLPVGDVLESDRWEDGDGKGRTDMEALWGEGLDGARKYEGARVGLQIVGERLQEERLLGMARVIEEVLR
jgi:amidase